MLCLVCCNSNGLARSSKLSNELPECYCSYLEMLYSVPLISESTKHSAKNNCLGPAKLPRLNFTITKDDFEVLQAGYQPDNHLQYGMVCKGDWCKYLRAHFEAAVDN